MWSYYGSKSKIINYYPAPTKDLIIEPFAGSARYALKYWENDVIICDKYERLINIWLYLQNASVKDIEKLPILKKGENLNNFQFICKEEKDLLGFMIQAGVNAPRLTCTEAGVRNQVTAKKNILNNLHKIKHWDIRCCSYTDVENKEATWFIDPPYQFGGKYYIHKQIDYTKLKDWIYTLNGEIIVCENTKANWIELQPLKKIQGMAQTNTTEAIFLKGWGKNIITNGKQETLFNERT